MVVDDIDNYTVKSSVSTGKNNLPAQFSGGGDKKLEIHTSTGDIDFKFAGK